MRIVAFCEIKPFCREVLAKHWPDIPCHDDITTREFHEGEADVICGGFPCQDVSVAGQGAGLTGERSGLYRYLIRAIRLVRPRFAIVENVAALLGRGMGTVLGDLAEIGYDAEWHCIPAAAIGAPHIRDRIWIVAYPNGERELQSEGSKQNEWGWLGRSLIKTLSPDFNGAGFQERQLLPAVPRTAGFNDDGKDSSVGSWWAVEPNLVRVVHGIPGRMDRIEALGNAVIPQIPEIIGRAIMDIVENDPL
jgi:DNA (cytosine-5)-methyltransferase 1